MPIGVLYGANNNVYCMTLIELKFHHLPVEEFDSPGLQQMHELHRIVCQAQEKHEVKDQVVPAHSVATVASSLCVVES